ncbi:hypothetical protein LTR36_005169 [Oleoguttula mirabilis]|uniref:Gonadal aromatase n=1 Tax=Oleoguttula mirabilis TaxID=1507867 RepID=A0AAV9JXK5_9PEZI|nr:hypothetical protein LTR36_005169 [Oleoguttula mirabilis]
MSPSLQDLPPELRLMIYDQVFAELPTTQDGKLDREAGGLRLLQVCSLIRQEAIPVFRKRVMAEMDVTMERMNAVVGKADDQTLKLKALRPLWEEQARFIALSMELVVLAVLVDQGMARYQCL